LELPPRWLLCLSRGGVGSNPLLYVKTDGDQRNAQQKAYAAALEEQNAAMKKRIESLQQEAGKVPGLQQQVDQLKQQLDAEPLATPTPKKQEPVDDKPNGFTEQDPRGSDHRDEAQR